MFMSVLFVVVFQVILLLVYLLVLLGLYLTPLSITSPCIMERHNLKARPAVIGQRGAPMVSPAVRQSITLIILMNCEIK
ncbi:glycerophosphodiester phosphodiesterase domain-containing protein 5 isoform X1 [Tachysurus ichikawai]